MSKLFIIGNGFDLSHNLPTSYENFHQFLLNRYPNADEEYAYVPTSIMGHHGEEIYNNDEVAGYLMNLLSRTDGIQWSDLERSLGQLDYSADFDNLPDVYDRDGDRNFSYEAENNERLSTSLSGCVPMIADFFSQWVNTIDITSANANPNFFNLIDLVEDYFLSFNYTLTLERLYNVENVCHVHGVQGQTLVFGHGNGPLFSEDNESAYFGSEDNLENIQNVLRKNTAESIRRHQSFFQNIQNGVTDIYFYGFSFGGVDQVYLEEIFRNVDTSSITCYLHCFDYTKHDKQREILMRCGFHGIFDIFCTCG